MGNTVRKRGEEREKDKMKRGKTSKIWNRRKNDLKIKKRKGKK